MSASAGVQVLDFTISLVYSNCQNDRKYCFVLFCFSFMCHVCVLSLISLFIIPGCSDVSPVNISFPIISGEFDALHQLSVKKKRIIWKYSNQSLKTANAVLLSLFMRDNDICDIPHAA